MSSRRSSRKASRSRAGPGGSSGSGGAAPRLRVHWSKVTAVGSLAPAGREGHTASLAGHRVYTFGGLENGVRVSKLLSFDLQRRRWAEHRGGGIDPHGVPPTAAVSDPDANAAAAAAAAAAAPAAAHRSTVSSATENPEVPLLDQTPPPRCYHAAWVVGHRLLYFGGEGSSSAAPTGKAAKARRSNTGAPGVAGDGAAVPRAGFKASDVFDSPATQRRTRRVCFDDVVLYNTLDHTWDVVKSGLAPLPRKGHTSTMVGQGNDAQVVVFGGEPSGKGHPMNDVHTVSVGSLLGSVAMWKKQRPRGDVPAPRHGHSAVGLPGSTPRTAK